MLFRKSVIMTSCLIFMLIFGTGAVSSAEIGLETAVDVTYAERYIWRGIPINEEAVLQPSLTLSTSGFSLNVWGNMDMTDWGEDMGYGDETGQLTEVDYIGGYEGVVGPVSFGLGFITYTFPNHTEWGTGLSTTELYLCLGFEVPLSPSITTYMDVDNHGKEGSDGSGYTSLDVSHSFELMEMITLDISGHLGYANHKFLKFYYGINEESDFHDWSASVALPISLPGGFSITPAYVYSAMIEDESREEVEDVWEFDPEAGIFMVTLGWAGDM